MLVTKFIAKNCIVADMGVSNKSDALKELTHLIFEKKKMKDVEPALDQVMARESTESTGVGRGIAIPHARIAGMKTLICGIGRVPSGIDFMAVDHKPVHLIFMIFYPPTQQTSYLNFVASTIRLVGDPVTRNAIMQAADADQIFDILETAGQPLAELPEKTAAKVPADPGLASTRDAHADLILLARMQLYQEMIEGARTGKSELRQRIEKIRALVDPRLLRHYDRLMKGQPPALVAVEGDTCQGCFMKLPSKFAQQVRQDPAHVHTCSNCSRFIYVV